MGKGQHGVSDLIVASGALGRGTAQSVCGGALCNAGATAFAQDWLISQERSQANTHTGGEKLRWHERSMSWAECPQPVMRDRRVTNLSQAADIRPPVLHCQPVGEGVCTPCVKQIAQHPLESATGWL